MMYKKFLKMRFSFCKIYLVFFQSKIFFLFWNEQKNHDKLLCILKYLLSISYSYRRNYLFNFEIKYIFFHFKNISGILISLCSVPFHNTLWICISKKLYLLSWIIIHSRQSASVWISRKSIGIGIYFLYRMLLSICLFFLCQDTWISH